MHLLAPTFGTLDLPLFVFRERQDDFERFLAIFTVELITRHKDLRCMPEKLDSYSKVYS